MAWSHLEPAFNIRTASRIINVGGNRKSPAMKWKYLREHHKRNEKTGQYDPIAGVVPEEEKALFSEFSAEVARLPRQRRPKRNCETALPHLLAPKQKPVFTDEAGRLYRYERGYRIYVPDVEAVVTFLQFEQGGRETPVRSGYSAQFYYDGHGWDAHHEFPDVACVYPDQTVRVLFRFLTPEIHIGHVTRGMEFEIREAHRVVGHGRVRNILHLAELAKTSVSRK